MKLTDIKCKTAKPREKSWKLGDGAGMYLEVMPNGSKYWRLKYRVNGTEKRLALGVYPEISLLEARKKRDEARSLLRDGTDPSHAKQDEKRLSKLSADNSFEVLTREWHERNKARWTPAYAKNVLERMEADIFPVIGNRPIASITPPHVLEAVRKIETRGAHEIARRALQCCGQVFRYAVSTGKASGDPTRDLKGALDSYTKGHYAALEGKDLPEFLGVINRNEARLYPQTLRALRLLMLTFVRTSELINATWDEFDLDNAVWTIPAARMKMRRDHIVPLSKQAVDILREQQKSTGQWKWVFPNLIRPQKSMGNNTILAALKRMGYGGRMTGHGFRALAMTVLKEDLGYRHETVDRQLAHAPRNKVDKAYDRAAFIKERTKMMEEWGSHLDALSIGGKVVVGDFKKRA
jgi:integrase